MTTDATAIAKRARLSPYLMRVVPLFFLLGFIALVVPTCRRAPAPDPPQPTACCVTAFPLAPPPPAPPPLPAPDAVTTASTKLFSFTAQGGWPMQSF